MSSIYEKIFGKVKKGNDYSDLNGLGGSYNPASLQSSMQKFRNSIYSGMAGKNLSKENADLIISILEPHLKLLPPGGKLSYAIKAGMREKLYHSVLSGKLSQEDFEDAKHIIDLF